MKRNAFTLVELVVTLILLVIVLVLFFKGVGKGHPPSKRTRCVSQLKQIYIAMYEYSADYDGLFPMIDLARGQIVGEDAVAFNRLPGGEDDPFKDIPEIAGRSISQNLWLLVRSGFAQPELFNCPGFEQPREFVLKDKKGKDGGEGPRYFIDFPYKKNGMTISYSFVQPWTAWGPKKARDYLWSADAHPRLAIGADANNGVQPNYQLTTMPAKEEELKRYVRSTNHNGMGQNVLYGDGHVTFEMTSYVGIARDNIYTAQLEECTAQPGQIAGILNVRPKNQEDSVLVPNREAELKNWDRNPIINANSRTTFWFWKVR